MKNFVVSLAAILLLITVSDSLDPMRLGGTLPQGQPLSAFPGQILVRNRAGRPIGRFFNYHLQLSYTGPSPSTSTATAITSGYLEAPPISMASSLTPVDIGAHWYNFSGLEWTRQQSGVGSSTAPAAWFYGHYDWRWDFPTNTTATADHDVYDPQRVPLIGYFRGDDQNVLDWQCYWLREAGIKFVVPVAFDLDMSSWNKSGDMNLWLYRMMNAPNCKGLSYIPWARSANFNGSVTAGGAPTGVTTAQITAQWQSLLTQLAVNYPNNYVMSYGIKRYFTVYVWDTEQLRALFDRSGGSTNTAAFYASQATAAIAAGYDGIAILTQNATPDATMSRAALLADNVLFLPDAYGGPQDSTLPGGTFTGSISGNTLTITAVGSGALGVGSYIGGAGLPTYPLPRITALGTGAGGTGSYILNGSYTVSSEALRSISGTYSDIVNTYHPPASGEVLSISTALSTYAPYNKTQFYNFPGTTPALFGELATKALNRIASCPSLPQMLTIYNVGEWAEGGPMLAPNIQDGWGYLDALRQATSSVRIASACP